MPDWAEYDRALKQRLATNVRALRLKQKMTLEEAAHEAAIDRRHWQKVEAADHAVTLTTLAKLAVLFDVEAADLLL